MHAQPLDPADSSWVAKWARAGVGGEVNALWLSGDSLFIGGDFSMTIDNRRFNDLVVLRLSDTSWHDINYRGDESGSDVYALARSEKTGVLYVGGDFDEYNGDTTYQHLIQWDGSTWQTLSGIRDSVNGPVHDIVIRSGLWSGPDEPDEIIIGGEFTEVDGQSAEGIARFTDGIGWDDMGANLGRLSSNAIVYDMDIRNSTVWVGGRIDLRGADTVANLVSYDFNDDEWSAPDGGPTNGPIRCLDAYGATSGYDKIVVGGGFTQINDSIEAARIAIYQTDTEAWTAIDSGLNANVYAVHGRETVSTADIIHAGGAFTGTGSIDTLGYFAMWESATQPTWEPIAGGVDNDVNAFLLLQNSTMIVGGEFEFTADSTYVQGVAGLGTADDWHGYGLGPNRDIYDIYIDENGVRYFVGRFDEIGNRPLEHLAVWGDSLWQPEGDLTDAPQRVLARGDTIYLMGSALTIDGDGYEEVAMWDGTQWSDMNGGLTNGLSQDMAFHPLTGELYVAG
ncbi:hypothetical protein GF420_08605, partial [candidate division GN15 bacterium]|nr:hypothetical protein [candidate division GN15 bacterium]